MTDLNTISLTGRLVKDITVKAVNDRYAVNGSIAVTRSYKSVEKWVDETSYFDVQQWAISTEFTKKLVKGTYVYITGSLLQKKWEDKDGKQLSRVVVIADRIVACPPQAPAKEAKTEEAKSANVAEAGDSSIPF